MRLRAALVVLWLAVAAGLWAGPAWAHDFRPGLLRLDERAPGRFEITWMPPRLGGAGPRLSPGFPEACRLAATTLECPDAGLTGEIVFEGIAHTKAEIIVQITWLDGTTRTSVAGARDGAVEVTRVATGGPWHVVSSYGSLGIEHILGGVDHLLFVLGLVLLVGFDRRLVWTITMFTTAHCITLVGSTLGLISLAQALVEIAIALSIALVAGESLHRRPTLTRRAPWAVAFAFGLLHGFGFAGALQEIGLPKQQIPLSLLSFNVGVELGQLGVIAALWFAIRVAPPRWAEVPRVRTLIAYVMGTAAVYWTLSRIAAAWSV